MNCHKLIFLLLTAILFILAACGSGDLVDLSQGSEEYLKMTDVKDNLAANGGLIQRCKGDVDLEEKPECKVFVTYVPPQGNSSSSEEWVPPEKSSSSAATEPTPSSSTGTTPSSSSVPSSSSAPPPPPPSSSSAATCGNNCAPIPAFTCAATPANPVSGDETTVNINITGSGEGCSTRAYVEIEAKTPFQQLACLAQSEIDVGVPIVTAGSKSASCLNNKGETFSGSWTWPTSGAITVIKGAVTCGTGVSQNTEAKTCAITIQAPPTPTKTGSIKFSNVDYSSGSSSYFYIGSEPQITHDVAITNGGDAEARCGDVETRIKGNADAAGTVTAEAYAVCRGSEHVLATATATVVPDPSLSGSCAWDTKHNTFGGGVNAKVTAAPTITNTYGRTCAGPYFKVGSEERETVATGLKVDAWDGNDGQKMTDITIGATCAGKATSTISCSDITVKDPNAMCEYLTAWCGGIALSSIKTANVTSDPPIGQAGSNQCFFATTVDKLGNVGGATVNGVAIGSNGKCGNTGWGQPSCDDALKTANVDATDGGYYVYIPQSGNWTGQDVRLTNSYAPNLHPNCEAQK